MSENKTYQNMSKVAKPILTGKSVALNGYIRNEESFQINNENP